MAKQSGKRIRLAKSGIKAVGRFKAGEVYEVGKDIDEQEAERLVKVKGFEYVNSAPVIADDAEQTKGGE
jgi:hypothetical protein